MGELHKIITQMKNLQYLDITSCELPSNQIRLKHLEIEYKIQTNMVGEQWRQIQLRLYH